MKKTGLLIPFLVLLVVLSGCSLLAQSTPTAEPTWTLQPTYTPQVVFTEIPLPTANPPTATPEPTSTPSPVMMISAEVVFDSYQLRTGPGRLFERVEFYYPGDTVTLIGREMSNNWVLVQTDDNRSGWMNVVGLEFTGSVITLPVFRVDNAQILQGHVYLPDQTPAIGIVVSLTTADKTLSDSYDTSTTNKDGYWAIYTPASESGNWIIGPNAFTCEVTNAATPTDEGCSLNGNLPDPQAVSLPFPQNVMIEFAIIPLNP